MQLADKLRSRALVSPLSAQPSAAPAGSLGQVIADLDLLNHDTEQDFLRIGGKLTEFMQAVSVISAELTALASSEQGQRASQALKQALARSTEMSAALGDRGGGLAGMHREVGLLKRTLKGLQGTVSTFHTLALLTRIETARLGSAGADFSCVADDVGLLAGRVHSRVESALAIAESLIPPIESAMREISLLEAGQARNLPALISQTLASLSSFREIQGKAHDSSIRLESQYSAISSAFKKLIVSIQFHDITRQQVEHVVEVLRRLSSDHEGQDGSISRHPRGMSAVLVLQSAQLADAAEKFAASVMTVERNLEEIANHVLGMAHESRALAGLNKDEKGSIFLPMEQDCGAILTSLRRTADSEAATRAARKGLEGTIGEMRGPIQEIQKIELQMRRVALNARISAFHLGNTGSALEVLAGSVQQLASECRERSESLGSMSEAATRSSLDCGLDPADISAKEDVSIAELRQAVEELHASTERSFAQIVQIVAHGDSLAGDLVSTRKGFSVGSLFAGAVKRVRGSMKLIGEQAQAGLAHQAGDEQEPGLAEFVSHYTMQAERDVHEGVTREVTGLAYVVGTTEVQNSQLGGADELGDNVEFF